jgi:hypothetical protein
MDPMKFNEEDKKQFILFLNFIGKNATFNGLKTQDIIEFFKLIQHMQQSILPKIEANTLEIKRVVEAKPEENKVE